jgi:glycosyltransferase involved in cell wall biosynthesis
VTHKFLFIANNNIGYGLSGGDTIFIQLLKNWQVKNNITLLACQEAINILPNSINKIKIIKTDSINSNSDNNIFNLFFHYLRRIFKGSISIRNSHFNQFDYVYTVSDFLPDLIPGFLLKLKYPKLKWIAGFYLFAPNPFSQVTPYNGVHRFKGFIYWLIQQITRKIVDKYSDIVFVTSVPDIKRFSPSKKVVVIQGGVDLDEINNFKNKHAPNATKKYSACFLGRFHPQKGCLTLIKIWHKVTKKYPQAKLAMIGQGEEETKMRSLINKLNLQQNIDIYGFMVGEPKYKIFSNSKIVVHPATYDSGGMASAEALAFGLPGVSFDLESLSTYYPQGFLKTKCF